MGEHMLRVPPMREANPMGRRASLETIFFECRGKGTPAERAAYLGQACAGDPELLRRVQKMLQAEDIGFLEQAAYVPDLGGPDLCGESAGVDRPGQRIGAYRLLEPIGEGGMGTVWRAEQIEPVQRQVALKLIKAGMDTRQVIARFEAERQALALMDHPHIARVLDAGADDVGRPFFVMELFAGVPITRYCDEGRLTVRRRLELFVSVCEAIQHAHQKGVIHRDVKPSNVLVALVDGRAMPKVIDFGIAKAIASPTTERTTFTQQGSFLGTLEYMSPEQAAGSAAGVDTRSDIYSLGALLYELLTGATPLSRQRVEQASFQDILRAIIGAETPKPSTALAADAAMAAIAAIATQRQVRPARLLTMVRGELDWIVMKALEKDRDRRYATAAAFAQDVQRYLADEPVLAGPPSTTYRLRKFARRHRPALAAAGVLLAGAMVAIGGIGWAVRDRAALAAEVERVRTERQARVAATVQELLAAADHQLAAQAWPEALATARRADGAATSGEADAATAQRVRGLLCDLEFVERLESIRSRQAAWGAEGFDSAAVVRDYARAFADHGLDVEHAAVETSAARLCTTPALVVPLAAGLEDWAGRHLEAKLEATGWLRLMAIADAIDPEPVRTLIRAGWRKSAATAAAELRRLAMSIDLRAQHPVTLGNLARCLRRFDEPAAALQLLRAAQRAHPGDFWLNFDLGVALGNAHDEEGALRHYTAAVGIRPDSAAAHNNLGYALRQRHELDAAIGCFRRAVELDPDLAMSHINLCRALLDQRKLDQALVSARKATDLAPNTALAWVALGTVLLESKRFDDASLSFQRALALAPRDRYAHSGLSNVRRAQGRLDEALAAAHEAIASAPDGAAGHIALGNPLAQQGRATEAIPAFRKAIELDPRDAVAHSNLGSALLAANDPALANEALAQCRQATELEPGYAIGFACLGNALLRHGQAEAAATAYRQAIALDPGLVTAHFSLAQLLASQKQWDEALAAYRQAIALRPDHRGALLGIARLHRARNEPDEAAAALRTLVGIDPGNAEAHATLAVVLSDRGRHDEAIAAYRRAAEIEPGNATRQLALGLALHRLLRLQEAAAAYRKAIELDPTLAVAHGVLGDVLHLQHQDDEAEIAYRAAIAADPGYVAARGGLGQALGSLGRFGEAIAAFEDGIRVGPTSADLASHFALLLAECPDAQLRDPARAVALARQAMDLEPEQSQACRALGVVEYRVGHWQEALDALQRAAELDQRSTGTDCFFMAMAHWQLGDAAAARSTYERVVEQMVKAHADGDDLRRLRDEAARLLGIEMPH